MRSPKTFWVYILTNRSGTLYIGVTNDLARRSAEHEADADGERRSFAGRYDVGRVYAEPCDTARDAIAREKQLKGWRRAKKVALVSAANPGVAGAPGGVSSAAGGPGEP